MGKAKYMETSVGNQCGLNSALLSASKSEEIVEHQSLCTILKCWS